MTNENSQQTTKVRGEAEERFPFADELDLPEACEGWREMYPEYFHFDLTDERTAYEHEQFWFWDKKDTTEPLLPWDLTISAQAWQIAMAQTPSRVFAIPPAMSVDIRIVAGYAYFTAIPCEDPELIGERERLFKERSDYYYENFNALYEGTWKPEVQEIGETIQSLDVPEELPRYVPDEDIIQAKGQSSQTRQVLENYNRLTELALEGWHRHFEFLYLAYLAYLTFTETCQELFPGISDDAIGKMVSAVDADVFRADQELNALAKLALELGDDVIRELKSEKTPEAKLESLESFENGQTFLERFEQAKDPWFYISYGDGFHSNKGSWIDDLEAPFEYLETKIERLESGEELGRDIEKLQQERDNVVAEYRSYLDSDEKREQFDQAYDTCMTIYEYAENHQFWIEHWLHTLIFQKMREFGQFLLNQDLLDDPEDIFLFTRFEVAELLEEACEIWALGPGGYGHVSQRFKDRAATRQEIIETARDWDPSPALGEPPEEITDPLVSMLWGVTTEKVYDWLEVESGDSAGEESTDHLEGFGASTGTIEGPARVLSTTSELDNLEEGEILVCPLTNPAWAPVFPRVAGAVTDDGGITSHAAIVCREYDLPAVTGTGHATSQIETGDRIRIDGEAGTVEILERVTET